MDQLHLEERESLNLAEYLWILRKGKWIILASVVVSVCLSMWITLRTQPVYQSSATFIYNVNTSMSQTLGLGTFFWYEIDPIRNNQIQIIKSRSMAESVADSVLRSADSDSLVSLLFNNQPPHSSTIRSNLIGLIRGNISVSVMKDTDFFILSATGSSPVAAAILANLVVHVYYRRNLEEVRGESREVREFLEEQLLIIENQLERDEELLKDFKEENSLVSLDEETRSLINNIANLESQASIAATSASAAAARREYLTEELELHRAQLITDIEIVNNEYISQIQNELGVLEVTRINLVMDGISENDPVFMDVESRIAGYREALTELLAGVAAVSYPSDPTGAIATLTSRLVEAEAELRTERVRQYSLEARVEILENSLTGLPEAEVNLARLERNRRVSENIYILLRTKYEETRISEAGQISNVTIIDTALPGGMIKPSRKRNLMMGFILGLAAGVGIVFLREQFDTSIKNPETIEKLGITLLGVVPKIGRSVLKKGKEAGIKAPDDFNAKLVTYHHPLHSASEAYRDVRTSLFFAQADRKLGSIIITSAGPKEGKSTTSANLAVTVAQAGQKCVIIDADLRKPVQHKTFTMRREPGLSEVVAGLKTLEDVLTQTFVENLQAIPSGFIPHNPSELLGSNRMKNIVEELKKQFDMIIFDTPPLAVVTDALVLSSYVDGILMVIDTDKSNRKVVQDAWRRLEQTSCNRLGAVLNEFDPLSVYTSYDYYAYRYLYYYTEEGDKKKKKHRH